MSSVATSPSFPQRCLKLELESEFLDAHRPRNDRHVGVVGQQHFRSAAIAVVLETELPVGPFQDNLSTPHAGRGIERWLRKRTLFAAQHPLHAVPAMHGRLRRMRLDRVTRWAPTCCLV